MIDEDALDGLDDRFAMVPDGADRQIRQYIASHPDEFFLPMRSKRKR